MSVKWKHPSSPKTKKLKVTPSAGRVFFWTARVLERGHTLVADRDCETLTRLREAIRGKWPGLLTEGIFLHDIGLLHTSQKTSTPLKQFSWDIDHPAYSPDLAPSDFYSFCYLKEHLGGRRFVSVREVKHFATTPKDWIFTRTEYSKSSHD